ncbi:MAG: hypothetical protein J2P57_11935 [Acidimicrobiaceae bacterium]|nr:hypothetical protein [Acidimicrobiaceae bacterium]
MTVGGDPSALRGLHGAFSSAASDGAGQGSALAGVMGALGTGNLAGPAGDQWRTYTSELQRANTAMMHAYDAMASLLPRVAAAVEEAQHAEQAKIKAAAAEEQAAQQLNAATEHLQFLTELDVLPGAVPASELDAARAAVATATHAFEDAQHRFQVAAHQFEDADRRRRALLKELATVCRAQASALLAAMPPCSPPTPYAIPIQGIVSELQAVRTEMLEIPTIASAWVAPALLPKLESAFTGGAAALPHLASSVHGLYSVAARPLRAWVPRPQHSGGSWFGKALAWGGVAVVTIGSGLAIAASDGTDTGLVTDADESILPSLVRTATGTVRSSGTAIGIGGLASEGFTTLDDAFHGQSIDPKGLIIAGSTGWVSAALPVGISSKLLGPAVDHLAPVLAVRASTGAATAAGLSAASQYALFHHVNAATTAVAAGGGLWGGAWPGAGDLPTIGTSRSAQVALGLHAQNLPGFTTALTDHSGPVPASKR